MKKILNLIFTTLILAPLAFATTYTVPGFSSGQIQSTINTANGAGIGNTVFFPAGTYSITSQITVPCNANLTLTGPVATTPTAKLVASFSNQTIFSTGNCTGLSVYYLNFAHTGGISFSNSNNSNIDIEHNSFTNLPSTVGGGDPSFENGVYFGGNVNNTAQNITIKYNLFGSSDSCTAVFGDGSNDDGGYCGGVYFSVGFLTNYVNEFNEYYHLEEGHKIVELGYTNVVGENLSVDNNVQIRYNYSHNHHRIAIETQNGVVGSNDFYVSDNIITDPINPGFYTMMISDACCQYGRTYKTSISRPSHMDDNVLYSTIPQKNGAFNAPSIGEEYWAAQGSTANNSVIGSYVLSGGVSWSNMITWGYEGSGSQTWYIQNNYICAAHSGTYITNEEKQTNAPIISGNTTPSTCTQQTSAAATISPAGGSTTFPKTISVTTAGTNTSVWYTIDGSNPVPGSGTAIQIPNGGTFVLNGPATVKAVGMWGVPPQPAVHAANLGYGPSAVVSQTYTGGGVSLNSISIASTGNVTSITKASTNQLTATGHYSDGSTQNLSSTATWVSGTPATGTVSSSGLFSALAVGSTSITAASGGVTSPGFTMSVTPPTLVSVAVTATGGATSLAVGGTNQLIATGTYSDGSTAAVSPSSWSVSNTSLASITSTGLATGISAGSVTFGSITSGISSPAFPLTITSGVALNNIVITSNGGINVMYLHWFLNWQAQCYYTDGTNDSCTTTDAHSNAAVFASSNTSLATFNGNILNEIAQGSGNVSASAAGVTSNIVNMTYLGTQPLVFTMVGATITITATSVSITYK